MLTKRTLVYAVHEVTLKCDVYEADGPLDNGNVVLYFHPGSLTGGTRELIPPWLVQACYHRRWTLISASYRFLPQVSPQGLVDDALAAYTFARAWPRDNAVDRPVIIAGASAGFFMACLICHHAENIPMPKTMLCITGTPTFQHDFYRSSILMSPKLITYEEVRHWLEGPLVAGDLPEGEPTFTLDMLSADGSRNTSFSAPEHQDIGDIGLQRWDLYDYYVYTNAYPTMLADVDPGFNSQSSIRQGWPSTIFVQGGADPYLPLSIITQAADAIGADKATVFIAEGQPHLFESATYLDDVGIAADTVRAALSRLDEITTGT